LRLPAVEAADAGNYDVVVTNSAGSVTSRAVALTVSGGINASVVVQTPATALAQGQSVTLRAVVTGATATSHRWLRDGVDIRTATSAASPMVRFRAKLEGAKLALNGGFADLARAQLEGLDRLVEKHRLDEWDPDLTVQLYATLYRAQRLAGHADSEIPEVRARTTATWERLCQLDGAAALRLAMEV
jgi:hypothetical protein